MSGNPQLDTQIITAILSVMTGVMTAAVLAFARWTHGLHADRRREMSEMERRRRDESEALKRIEATTASLPAISNGVRQLLKAELVRCYEIWTEKGWIDTEGREHVDSIYRAYHSLAGNGTGTKLHEELMALPIRRHG